MGIWDLLNAAGEALNSANEKAEKYYDEYYRKYSHMRAVDLKAEYQRRANFGLDARGTARSKALRDVMEEKGCL